MFVLENLAKFASEVPVDGIIVELGSFVGRSSYAIGMNKHPSVKMYCFDKWVSWNNTSDYKVSLYNRNNNLQGSMTDQIYRIETARENLKEVSNITLTQARLPLGNKVEEFPHQVDLIYIDAGHSYAETLANAEDWYPKMKKGGVMYFDDYSEHNFPDVVRAVDDFVSKYNLHTKKCGTQMAVYAQ